MVAPEFAVHKLNPGGILKAVSIAEAFDDLQTQLERVIVDGRYKSIVRTKLEEACFFAKKGMALDPENQVVA